MVLLRRAICNGKRGLGMIAEAEEGAKVYHCTSPNLALAIFEAGFKGENVTRESAAARRGVWLSHVPRERAGGSVLSEVTLPVPPSALADYEVCRGSVRLSFWNIRARWDEFFSPSCSGRSVRPWERRVDITS